MNDAGTSWTEDRVELLGKLWGEGLSASQIAGVLGGGVTRNAVIGKVHRLGLSGRAKPAGASPQRPSRPRAAAPPVATASGGSSARPPEADAPASLPATDRWTDNEDVEDAPRVALVDLRDTMCRWPLGDPTSAEFGFCGGRSVTGLPYCARHCRIAYQPAAERKRLRA